VNGGLDKMVRQVDQIHAMLFGVDGQGGLYRQVEALERNVQELKTAQAKTIGFTTAVSTALTLSGIKLWTFFGGK